MERSVMFEYDWKLRNCPIGKDDQITRYEITALIIDYLIMIHSYKLF